MEDRIGHRILDNRTLHCGSNESMKEKPLVVVEGARVEFDGEEVIVLIVPTIWKSKEQMHAFQRQFHTFGFPIALVDKLPDGRLRAVGSGSSREKLQAKIDAGIQWTKIPIFLPR